MKRVLRWIALAIVIGALALSVTDNWIARIALWLCLFCAAALWARHRDA